MKARHTLLGVALATLLSAPTSLLAASVDVEVNVAPPEPRVVEVPPPREGYVWAPGYYSWENDRYGWKDGRWMRERRGEHWVADKWERDGERWRFRIGHWDRD